MWLSSLTDSTAKGKPDIEAVDVTSRVQTVSEIVEVTTKPIVYDGDTGGKPEHFVFTVKTLERLGVSAVIIEDKLGLKKNSLFGTEAGQAQDSIESFGAADRRGQEGAGDRRLHDHRPHREPHPRGRAWTTRSTRAEAYVEAGADGIMIHSSQTEPAEILEFCERYNELPEAAAAGRRAVDVQRRSTSTSSRRPASTSSSTPTSCCAAPIRPWSAPPSRS